MRPSAAGTISIVYEEEGEDERDEVKRREKDLNVLSCTSCERRGRREAYLCEKGVFVFIPGLG